MSTSSTNVPSTTSAPLIPDKILPNLYLSDIHTARAVLSPNYPAPGRPEIRYVLSVIDGPDKQPQVSPGHEEDHVLHLISIRDHGNMDLLEVLDEALNFIKAGLANNDGGVLVHCQKGISRSASVIIAFVMEDMNLDFDTALRFVRSSRAKVNPNAGFQRQLELWQQLEYSLYEADGQQKEEYQIWKANNEEQIRSLGDGWKKYLSPKEAQG
ncbi:hypothetical protein A1O1_00048 [Capronia coronata CBS 617.96]|uniref:Uncharacterized protein n=1 Tax=Capronia coronata CBS 617.96 TaxID=1182541 RepID=W9YZ33_9EURO|nr:uncharacterized protein A1O1_00048 [Capronia coronata CBS 617.96]EXJ94930.1 hypothetical protein A1O1_00048 [Capronia coronata CBS 617.96]